VTAYRTEEEEQFLEEVYAKAARLQVEVTAHSRGEASRRKKLRNMALLYLITVGGMLLVSGIVLSAAGLSLEALLPLSMLWLSTGVALEHIREWDEPLSAILRRTLRLDK
jgi:hypothetical protein